MNRQHYEHMVEEVKYLKEVFEHIKETFFRPLIMLAAIQERQTQLMTLPILIT